MRFCPPEPDSPTPDEGEEEQTLFLAQPEHERERSSLFTAQSVRCSALAALVIVLGAVHLGTGGRAFASVAKRLAGKKPPRVAVVLNGWIKTTVVDGGRSIRTYLVNALAREADVSVFQSFTFDRVDGCGTARAHSRCDAAQLLPELQNKTVSRISVTLSPSTARLLRIFEALPHWSAMLAAHNAKGSPVACRAVAGNATDAAGGGYTCTGLYKGNSFLAPVLGDRGIHNLHQLHALATALRLVSRHELKEGFTFDRVVHTRLDLQWLRPHPSVRLLSPQHAWIPSGEDYYGGLNDRHAVLNRTQASIYFGRWNALIDGTVMQIDPQLAQRRVDRGVAMTNEHLLAATLRHHGVSVRRFPAVAHLRCCDGREMCFADGRYTRDVPASLEETGRAAAWSVCGKYPFEVEMAVQHALALVVPGARYAAANDDDLHYRTDSAPSRPGPSGLAIVAPVQQRAPYRSALERLKRRWYTTDSERIVWGAFREGEDDKAGDCNDGHKGMWRMGPGHSIIDLESCARHCFRLCPRCRFVSASPQKHDCSWFAECDMKHLHLEWSGDLYRTIDVVSKG